MSEQEKQDEDATRAMREGATQDSQEEPNQAAAAKGAQPTPWGPPLTGESLKVLQEFAERARKAGPKPPRNADWTFPVGSPNTLFKPKT